MCRRPWRRPGWLLGVATGEAARVALVAGTAALRAAQVAKCLGIGLGGVRHRAAVAEARRHLGGGGKRGWLAGVKWLPRQCAALVALTGEAWVLREVFPLSLALQVGGWVAGFGFSVL